MQQYLRNVANVLVESTLSGIFLSVLHPFVYDETSSISLST